MRKGKAKVVEERLGYRRAAREIVIMATSRCSLALISVFFAASFADEPYHDPYNDPVSNADGKT